MKTLLDRRTLLVAVALTLAGGGVAYSDDREHNDHDRARRALEEGQARPLAEILARVKDRLGGDVVGVEFDRKKGRYIYEFRVVAPGGRLRAVYVDAMTAEIVKNGEE